MSKYTQIDKIDIKHKYLIDYINLKEGIIKNQKKFVDKKEFNLFIKNEYLGLPVALPIKNRCFEKSKLNFSISKKVIKEKLFKVKKNYKPLNNFLSLGNIFSISENPKKKFKKSLNIIKKINNETKAKIKFFKKKNKIIGAFQTRNIPHFGHQKILELMLKKCDYVFINPLLGPKKIGDINSELLSRVYKYFVSNKYCNKVIYAPICANMFYAGPREAVHHALLREQLGFDYFIVGRDHAGAENVYKPDQAINLIRKYKKRFKIKIIAHKGAFFCDKCKKTVISGDCNHKKYYRDISGNEFRKCIKAKKIYKYADINLQKYIHKLKIS